MKKVIDGETVETVAANRHETIGYIDKQPAVWDNVGGVESFPESTEPADEDNDGDIEYCDESYRFVDGDQRFWQVIYGVWEATE